MFCGDLLSALEGAHKRLLQQVGTWEGGIAAEGSDWRESPSGGPECVSVKTATLSRKSVANP